MKQWICLLVVLVLSWESQGQADAQEHHVKLVAGVVKGGFSGDGGPATQAQIRVPSGCFVDADGRLLFVDTTNNRIRAITPDGIINTIAGNGQRVFTTDGQKATETAMDTPSSVFVDRSGSIYFSEWSGHRVRRIDPDGRVWTVAGTGMSGYVGEDLPALETPLWSPSSVFLDGKGNLFIAEWKAHRVRRVAPDGTISTYAGNGENAYYGDGGPATEASISNPNDIFIDASGVMYIADTGNNRIRRVDTDGIITTVAGGGKTKGDGGPATAARIGRPTGVFVDTGGNLYVAASRSASIRRVDMNGIITTLVKGTKKETHYDGRQRAILRGPSDVFVDAKGDLYITDGSLHVIRCAEGVGVPTQLVALRDDAVLFHGEAGVNLSHAIHILMNIGSGDADEGFDARLDFNADGILDFNDLPTALQFAIGF